MTNWRVEIAKLADVTALQALEATRRLVNLLTGRRWATMQAARAAGASWSEIGTGRRRPARNARRPT
ncbi:hypothetical protein [Nocardia sp. XZ_19_385]|uniref:hypothetical protein n=1 Tax=Nocardia sp. XZ_19_385 TaxID=2769488 RepID=UPI00188EDB15|nr:hypothetical protein [Nocardia sp. XZ_19_385]